MFQRTKLAGIIVLSAISVAACDRQPLAIEDPGTIPLAAVDTTFYNNPNLRFRQVERLGNPLAMEVFVEKREHSTHDTFPPVSDPGHFTDDYVYFITNVAKRDEAYARAIAGALLGTDDKPGDMIRVYTNRAAGVTAANSSSQAATSVGWLSYVLNPSGGYGGRRLVDDVVDIGTAAVFGDLLGNTNNVTPSLVGDNVDANDKAFSTTFPYLAAPTGT